MTAETDTEGRIGPQLSLDEVDLPPAVGERLSALYGRGETLDTAAEWIDATATAVEATRGRAPTVADLCTSPDGSHRFVGADGESRAYVCVLDPLAYPFIAGTTGIVRSETPVREAEVTFDVEADGLDFGDAEVLISVGVSDHVDAVEAVTPEAIYRQVCPYVQVFADEREYETWAADVEAGTTAVSATRGVALAREIATVLFESAGSGA